MVTHIVDGKSQVHLPRRPLAVTMSVVGSPGSAVLQARHGSSADPDAIGHNPTLLILPRVQHDTTIVVLPGSGLPTFPSGTVVHVAIAVDSTREPDPDRAQLTPRDVSGLASLELATVSLDGDLLAVTTRLDEPELTLGPLASRARATARGVLGVDQVSDSDQRPIDIWIDTSVSMLGVVRDGTVHAALDILAGVCAVVAADHVPTVHLVGARTVELSRMGLAELGDTVQTALEGVHYGVGFSPAVAADPSRRTSILVSDSATAIRQNPGAAVMVLSNSSTASGDPTMRGAVIAPTVDSSSTTTHQLLADLRQVDDIVEAFVTSVFRGTAETVLS